MQYLGRTLDACGLHNMADRARLGHYDDYFCPPDVENAAFNNNRLVEELKTQYRVQVSNRQRILIGEVIQQAMDGEFDGTKEESDAWARSVEGQAVFNELFWGGRKQKDE